MAVFGIADDELVPLAARYVHRNGEFVVLETIGDAKPDGAGKSNLLGTSLAPDVIGLIAEYMQILFVIHIGRELGMVYHTELQLVGGAIERADGCVDASESGVLLAHGIVCQPAQGTPIEQRRDADIRLRAPVVFREQRFIPDVKRNAKTQPLGNFEAERRRQRAQLALLPVFHLLHSTHNPGSAQRDRVVVDEIKTPLEVVLALIVQAEHQISSAERPGNGIHHAGVVKPVIARIVSARHFRMGDGREPFIVPAEIIDQRQLGPLELGQSARIPRGRGRVVGNRDKRAAHAQRARAAAHYVGRGGDVHLGPCLNGDADQYQGQRATS